MFNRKYKGGVVAVVGCMVLVAFFQTPASAQHFAPATATNAKQFVGVWTASFHGSAFLTVTLTLEGNKLAGKVSHANIELSSTGELAKAEANDEEPPDPITDARVNGDRLRITAKSADGSGESIEAEIKLITNNEADFRIVVPPDVPAPKPWRLERAVSKRPMSSTRCTRGCTHRAS